MSDKAAGEIKEGLCWLGFWLCMGMVFGGNDIEVLVEQVKSVASNEVKVSEGENE